MDEAALVEEATKKSGLIWLDMPDVDVPRAAWHVWHEGSAYVVTGGVEQPLPGLREADRVAVTVRSSDKGGRLVTWTAAVKRIRTGTDEWNAVAPLLARGRLNAPDGPAQVDRWTDEAYIFRLTPTGEVLEAPGRMPDDNAAVRPVPSPATTVRRRPRMIGAHHRRADR